MKIEKITLENFGSYEGITEFELSEINGKNIILIGGKNGAGKTTLFTAMRLCLYGYASMGYKNQNSYYTRSIIKLINNSAKLNKPATASITMELSITSGRDKNYYKLIRMWTYDSSLQEVFIVYKNDNELSTEEVYDFEKYIANLVPPELFNLYFFDGEKIADFFLEDGGNTRIKNAFLTLCGYDVFDIMSKQFKRLNTANSDANPQIVTYMKAKQDFAKAQNELELKKIALQECMIKIDECAAEIKALDKKYEQSGGVSEEYWNLKISALKDEEKKRDALNTVIKKEANETIPFLMVRHLLEQIVEQIRAEEKNSKYVHFIEILNHPEIIASFESTNTIKLLQEKSKELYFNGKENILELSLEDKSVVVSQINNILNYDKNEIIKAKKKIKTSINKSAKIRAELEKSNVEFVKHYMATKAKLLEQKSTELEKQIELENEVRVSEESLLDMEVELNKFRKSLEDELKKKSINDISSKAIIMLDKLQNILYHNQIRKVEDYFRKDINLLMRKTKFIDDICIDDDFNIRLFRYEKIKVDVLIKLLRYELDTLSVICVDYLKDKFKCSTIKDITYNLINYGEEIEIPVEIDKTLFSNGEKQIFIMALYHSLVQLSNNEIPFVIDTPFARIDTEHRNNIAEYFFRKLKGQVFILSTNEEIDDRHINLMKDKIAYTYMLENIDNKKTTVLKNTYFEVQ